MRTKRNLGNVRVPCAWSFIKGPLSSHTRAWRTYACQVIPMCYRGWCFPSKSSIGLRIIANIESHGFLYVLEDVDTRVHSETYTTCHNNNICKGFYPKKKKKENICKGAYYFSQNGIESSCGYDNSLMWVNVIPYNTLILIWVVCTIRLDYCKFQPSNLWSI